MKYRFFQPMSTTIDMEIVYFICNIWWMIVFISPSGTFAGVVYDRAILTLGQDLLLFILVPLIIVGGMAFLYRSLVVFALSTGPIVFMYFGLLSFSGTTIGVNAIPLCIVALKGFYTLLAFTYHRE